MTLLHNAQQLAYISRNTRWLFRKDIWGDVSAMLSHTKCAESTEQAAAAAAAAASLDPCSRSSMGGEKPAYPLVEFHTADAVTALKHTNWNVVQQGKKTIRESCWISDVADAVIQCPVAVVMLYVDVSTPPPAAKGWTDAYITSVIKNGVIYGSIDASTHIVLQIHYKGLDTHSSATSSNNAPGLPPPMSEAIAVVIVDAAGMAYCYNMPGGDCEHVGFRCVSKLLQMTVAVTPSIILKVVNYRPRTPYDDNLYALYVTAACAADSSSNAVKNVGALRNDLASCRPSARCARPTRIVANLRFLMLLCNKECSQWVSELLLDEKNTLDAFRRIAIDVHDE